MHAEEIAQAGNRVAASASKVRLRARRPSRKQRLLTWARKGVSIRSTRREADPPAPAFGKSVRRRRSRSRCFRAGGTERSGNDPHATAHSVWTYPDLNEAVESLARHFRRVVDGAVILPDVVGRGRRQVRRWWDKPVREQGKRVPFSCMLDARGWARRDEVRECRQLTIAQWRRRPEPQQGRQRGEQERPCYVEAQGSSVYSEAEGKEAKQPGARAEEGCESRRSSVGLRVSGEGLILSRSDRSV